MTSQDHSLSNKEAALPDVSLLAEIHFGPNWARTELKEAQRAVKLSSFSRSDDNRSSRDRRAGASGYSSPRGPSSNARSDGRARINGDRSNSGGRNPSNPSSFQFQERKPYAERKPQPSLQVYFHAEESALEALTQGLKGNKKTYPLFELANLILEKNERWAASIARPPSNPGVIWVSMVDDMPFINEQQALQHALKKGLELFCDQETVNIEGPKGSFGWIYRCGITKELVGPPNYHRYHEILAAHQRTHLPRMSVAEIQTHLEKVTEPEIITEWVTKMSTATLYKLKERRETDPESFPSAEKAQQYLKEKKLNLLLKNVKTFHLSGRRFGELLEGPIKQAIFVQLQEQKRFPLVTATHLKSRLKRAKLFVIKRSARQTDVCAVEPKQREEGVLFSESAQHLINTFEKNPKADAMGLIKEALEIPSLESLTAQQEEHRKLLLHDLHWLVSEGYIIEYSNGKLWLPPKASEAAQTDASQIINNPEPIETAAPELLQEINLNVEDKI
jgi:hypothetical protein